MLSAEREQLEWRRLALNLLSEDVAEAQEARVEVASRMAPERLVDMWRRGEQNAMATLLCEAEAVGNHDIYAALGDGFGRLFDGQVNRAAAEEFLLLDTTDIVARFLVNGVSHLDISVAAGVLPALRGLLAVVPRALAPRVGELLSAALKSERVLRLFDEDRPDSVGNKNVCEFLSLYTDLIPFITSSATDAFDNDPLLVANYLAVSGIISRHMNLPQHLAGKLERTLAEGEDDFVFSCVCRTCATALRFHEVNASRYAASWGTALAKHRGQRASHTVDAIYDLFGAMSTTASGWGILQSCLSVEEEIMRMLGVRALRETVLDFMCQLVQSPYVMDPLFGPALLRAAWQLHKDVDDVVREKLWFFLNCALAREGIMPSLELICAPFFCSFLQESCVNIRELQLKVATRLLERTSLSQDVVESLKRFCSRGLYKPFVAEVAAMEHR